MAWRDDLLPATLDGVSFFYRSTTDEKGRKDVLFEFPGRTLPFVEDLGKATTRFSVDAFLIGANYHLQLEALESVLDSEGPHRFQHPYRGEFDVKLVGGYKVTQSDTKGGFASVTFTLVVVSDAVPLEREFPAATITVQSTAAEAALASETPFDLTGAISDVNASVAGALSNALNRVNKASAQVAAILGVADNTKFFLDEIRRESTQLLSTPTVLIARMTSSFRRVFSTITDFSPPTPVDGVITATVDLVDTLLEAYESISSFTSTPSVVPTATAQAGAESEGHAAIQLTMQAGVLSAAVDAITELELDSSDQATAIQTMFADDFDSLLELDTLPVEVYEAFAALKGTMIRYFSSIQGNLPSLTNYTPAATLPSLVIAHHLYGDLDLEQDLITRNKIRHPLFIAGGVELEALSDD